MNPLKAPWLGLTTLFALATPVLASAAAPPEVQAICKRISDMKLERTCLAMVETNRYDCPRTSHPELCEYMIRYVLPKQLYSKCSSLKAEGASSAEDNEVLCQAITRRNEMYCNRVHDEIGVTECRYMVRAFSALDVHAANAGAAADTADEPVTRSTGKMDWVTWEGEDPATAPVIWKMLLGDTEPENGNAQAMGVSIVQPGEIFDLHHHRQPEIYHVLSGEGIVEIGGVAKRAKAGDTFYIPGNAPTSPAPSATSPSSGPSSSRSTASTRSATGKTPPVSPSGLPRTRATTHTGSRSPMMTGRPSPTKTSASERWSRAPSPPVQPWSFPPPRT